MNKFQQVGVAIREADAILIGASNGLSISDRYNIFADDTWFRDNFGDFRKKYGFRNLLQGMMFSYPNNEEKWAFYSRLAYLVHYKYQSSEMMGNLFALVKDKPYFIVTTNGEDHFTPAGFSSDCIFEMEGKLIEYHCAKNCHDTIYNNREDVLRMAQAQEGGIVPTKILPKCMKCGGDMEPNMPHGEAFFTTANWKKKQQIYQSFLQQYRGRKIVILELGIGWRNQMIKAPFMNIAVEEPHCTYVAFNKGELYIPKEIENISIGIDGDLSVALKKIVTNMKA